MALTKETTPVKATRITYKSATPFDVAESRLRASIQKNPDFTYAKVWSQAMQSVAKSSDPKATFTSKVEDVLGPHSFMHFTEFDHGAWLPIFDASTAKAADGRWLKAKRFILGNPLIAITMLRQDLDAGLYVPTELILVEEDAAGSRIVYQQPSGLIAGFEGAEEPLRQAAEELDRKLEGLVRDVLRV